MPTYYGFNTIGICEPRRYNLPGGTDGSEGDRARTYRNNKNFTLTDQALVQQDFINSLNIRQGQKVGQPGYGTTLWDFVFDPNTIDVQQAIVTELRRVATSDPRIVLGQILAYPEDNGILVEVEIAYQPFNNTQAIRLFLDRATNSVLQA